MKKRVFSILLLLCILLTMLSACSEESSRPRRNDRDKTENKTESTTRSNQSYEDNLPDEEDDGYEIVSASAFSGGVAAVTYCEDGENRCGLIDVNGRILYSRAATQTKPDTITPIGNGGAVVCRYDSDQGEYLVDCIVNRSGNVVAQLEEDVELVAYGDGLALVYRKENSISSVDYLCGVIDSNGSWVCPMTALEGDASVETNDPFRTNYYAGDGIFAIHQGTFYYKTDYAFLNSKNGAQFTLNDLRGTEPYFSNGKAYVSDNDAFLYTDGSMKECDLKGRDYIAYTDGVLVTEDNDLLYLGDSGIYDDYSADMLIAIKFSGNYGCLLLRGADYCWYTTMIDRNGNGLFEPVWVEMGAYAEFEYSNDVAIFKREGWLYCIVDASGKMIETDYKYMTTFSDGLAAASVDGSTWVYINSNNEVVISAVS